MPIDRNGQSGIGIPPRDHAYLHDDVSRIVRRARVPTTNDAMTRTPKRLLETREFLSDPWTHVCAGGDGRRMLC